MTSLSHVTSDSLHPLNLASLVATDLTTTTTCAGSREGSQRVTGTQQYEVQARDTLSSVAAKFDMSVSELKKLNRIMSSHIFTGQKLTVPVKDTTECNTTHMPHAVTSDSALTSASHMQRRHQSPMTDEDRECLERFLKIEVRRITLDEGVVSGILLVTPNAVMFDPNVTDPLVMERGTEPYCLTVKMDAIARTAIFCDFVVSIYSCWSGEGHDSTRPEVYSGQLSSRSSHCNFNINSNVPDQSSLHSFSIEDTDSSASMVTASDDVTEGSLNSEQQAGSHSNASASSQTDDKEEDKPLFLWLWLRDDKRSSVTSSASAASALSTVSIPIAGYADSIHNTREHWFSVPRTGVQRLFSFFQRWVPHLYGEPRDLDLAVEGDEEVDAAGVIGGHLESGRKLVRQVTKDLELKRTVDSDLLRSASQPEETQLPDLIDDSAILQDIHLRQLQCHLPARAVGYRWRLVFCCDRHGFSLQTMYRVLHRCEGPVLLVICDVKNVVFGGMLSSAPKVSELFYGTGESLLFTFHPHFKIFAWAGTNDFFMKGNLDSFTMGAGGGSNGLWLDGDLNHGRSQTCETFANDILTEEQDFIVKGLEIWGFV